MFECLSTPHRMNYSFEVKFRSPDSECKEQGPHSLGVFDNLSLGAGSDCMLIRVHYNFGRSCSGTHRRMAYSAWFHLNLSIRIRIWHFPFQFRFQFQLVHFIVVSTVCDLSRCSIKINMQICTTVGFGYIAKTSDYRLTSVTLIKAQKRKFYYIYFLIIVNSLPSCWGEIWYCGANKGETCSRISAKWLAINYIFNLSNCIFNTRDICEISRFV